MCVQLWECYPPTLGQHNSSTSVRPIVRIFSPKMGATLPSWHVRNSIPQNWGNITVVLVCVQLWECYPPTLGQHNSSTSVRPIVRIFSPKMGATLPSWHVRNSIPQNWGNITVVLVCIRLWEGYPPKLGQHNSTLLAFNLPTPGWPVLRFASLLLYLLT